jgi:N-formylglutamate amidohydrolase
VDCLRDRLLNRQQREDRLTTFHTVSHFDANRSIAIEHDVHPGAEFYQAHSLAALYPIANFVVENDAARNETGNLLEDHGAAIAF